MMCPFCNYLETKVVDSRENNEFPSIRRRRECIKCEKRFTTYEKLEEPEIIVLKRQGKKEKFSREKIITGIKKACKKDELSNETIEKIALNIEAKLKEKETIEVKSDLIGKMILGNLKKLDAIVYLRFASVYEDFENPDEFYDFIGKTLKKGDNNETTR